MNNFIISKNKNLNPLKIVEKAVDLFPNAKKVLDIGSGTGRNSIFLVCQGYSTEAIDVSEQAIEELNVYTKENGISIHAHAADISTVTPDFVAYNMILFTFVLHYLTKSRGREILCAARKQAKIGTVHVIAAITTEGDFFKKVPNRFYPKMGELKDTYIQNGWNIKECFEKERSMNTKKEDGTPMKNFTTFLIAVKV